MKMEATTMLALRLLLCGAALVFALPAALANHYILPCDDDCRDGGTPIQPGMTGAWGAPERGTYDFMLEVLPGQPLVLSAAWLTFAAEGGPMWVVGRGPVNGNHATLSAYRAALGGGQFASNSSPAATQTEYFGTLTLIFDGCSSGQVSWSPVISGYASGVTDIVRLAQPAGLMCTPGTTVRSPPGDTPDTSVQSAPDGVFDADALSDLGGPQRP